MRSRFAARAEEHETHRGCVFRLRTASVNPAIVDGTPIRAGNPKIVGGRGLDAAQAARRRR
jgi:hypothetical protein